MSSSSSIIFCAFNWIICSSESLTCWPYSSRRYLPISSIRKPASSS